MTTDRDLLIAFWRTYTTDDFGTPESLQRWLDAQGLWDGGEPPSDEDLRAIRHLRAATGSFLQFGLDADPRTRATIEAATRNAPLTVTLEHPRGLRLETGGRGVARAMGEIVAALYRVAAAGNLERIKLCKSCGWAFYDESKNRSRIWCDMGSCGAREKARAYRLRRKESEKRRAEEPATP